MFNHLTPFEPQASYHSVFINTCLSELQFFPNTLKILVEDLTVEQKNKQYREGSWTIAQVVNHLADSHTHMYIRLKFALTNPGVQIMPYDENTWANLYDGINLNYNYSLQLVEAIHQKIVFEVSQLNDDDFNKYVVHPQYNKNYTVAYFLDLYSWHGKHHLAQIKYALSL